VRLDDYKLAQLIGNRQKLKAGATSENFSRQIAQYFSTRKVHNRTVPLCSPKRPRVTQLTDAYIPYTLIET
jgi:hypothetical protein